MVKNHWARNTSALTDPQSCAVCPSEAQCHCCPPPPTSLTQTETKQAPMLALQATSRVTVGFKKKIFNGICVQIICYNKNIQNVHNTKIFRNKHCSLCFLLFPTYSSPGGGGWGGYSMLGTVFLRQRSVVLSGQPWEQHEGLQERASAAPGNLHYLQTKLDPGGGSGLGEQWLP